MNAVTVAIIGTSHVHVRDYVEACEREAGVRIIGAFVDSESPYRLPAHVPQVVSPVDLPPHDLAIVTTDTASHRDVVGTLAAPSLFLEKPLGTGAADAREVLAALRRRRREAHTGFFLRHDPGLQRFRDDLAADRIGPLRSVSMRYEHDGIVRGWLDDWPAHRSSTRMGYGAFGDLAAHLVDCCHWMLGPVRPVSCARVRPPGRLADAEGRAELLTKGGVPVRLRAGGTASATRLELSVEGERGTLSFRDGVLVEHRAGSIVPLYRGVEPTPARGLLSVLGQTRRRERLVGATLDDALAVNDVLDQLYAAATARDAGH